MFNLHLECSSRIHPDIWKLSLLKKRGYLPSRCPSFSTIFHGNSYVCSNFLFAYRVWFYKLVSLGSMFVISQDSQADEAGPSICYNNRQALYINLFSLFECLLLLEFLFVLFVFCIFLIILFPFHLISSYFILFQRILKQMKQAQASVGDWQALYKVTHAMGHLNELVALPHEIYTPLYDRSNHMFQRNDMNFSIPLTSWSIWK